MQSYIQKSFIDKSSTDNLAAQVFEIIQQSIATGELQPNERLVESEIAKALGVSRTPVREALKRLEITGYVRTLSSGGVAVAAFSASQLESLFEIRIALETMALGLACLRITEEQINKAEEYYKNSIEAIRHHDIDRYIVLHRSFHETLYKACGNEQLWSLVRIFRYQYFDRMLARAFTAAERRSQIVTHARLLEAVRERNANRAEKILRRIFKTALRIGLKRLP